MERQGSRQRSVSKHPVEEEGLLFIILASLPLLKIFDLRRVCKLWNSVLRSPSFWEAWLTRHESCSCCAPWLVMARKPAGSPAFARELVAFDSATGAWISLEALMRTSCSEAALKALGGPSCRLVTNHSIAEGISSFSQFQAAGCQAGLACLVCAPFWPIYTHALPEHFDDATFVLQVFDWRANYVLVINPLTGSHNVLPPPLRPWPCHLEISLQALPHRHYRVFGRAIDHEYPGVLSIYDSRSGSWSAGRSCWSCSDAKVARVKDFEQADFVQFKVLIGIVFMYNVELDEWSHVCARFPYACRFTEEVKSFETTVIRHKGQLLVARVLFDTETSLAGLEVWELRPRTCLPPGDTGKLVEVADWVKVTQTPRPLWEGFFERDQSDASPFDIKIISSGSLICMTARLYGGKHFVPLVYDLNRDFWYHLPPYKGHYDIAAVFGMRPCMAAVA